MTELVAVAGGSVVAAATMARVYRGGTTLNDHAVAALVTGCVAIYPILWIGAVQAGVSGVALACIGAVLALACVSLYGLFHILDARRDPGGWMWIARVSQPAFAFSLWCGLLLLVRAPWAAWTGASLLWPGPIVLVPAGLALWGWAWTALGDRDRENTVPLSLPRPVRVAHLSDIHVSPTMRARDMHALVTRTNTLRPDVVVVTGDLVMPFSEDAHDYLIEGLARLDAPTFVCLGNHDLPIAARLVAELEAAGVRVLVDSSTVVHLDGVDLEIVGVNFHWQRARDHLLAALGALPPPPADARLLLAHDPRLFAWVPDGRFDLVLSGHTHGGQVGTDMFGVPWSVLRLFGVYDQGAFRRGATHLWVHRGNWHTGLPPRMGIATEVVVHVLA
jgi:predicted MPP superfamily phosphohydrolase